MTKELSPIIKMKAMMEAGYHYPEIWQKYAKVIDFMKTVAKHSCCMCTPECCLACDAEKLLRAIGETDEP